MGGLKGGKARAESLTPAKRKMIGGKQQKLVGVSSALGQEYMVRENQ
jgi:hypothetical protein